MSTSATALAIIAKAKMPLSVKSTVSIKSSVELAEFGQIHDQLRSTPAEINSANGSEDWPIV